MTSLLPRFYCLIVLLALGLLAAPGARAQAPAWQSLLMPPDGYGSATATTTDASGNVYLAGFFNGTLRLGSTTLVAADFADIFVAKWSPSTNSFVWAKRAGGAKNDLVSGIAVSGSNVYVVGGFESTPISFGNISLSNAQPPSAPFNTLLDGYVAKLVDTGTDANFVWAQPISGLGYDQARAVVAAGNTVYVAGQFGAPAATFGTITVPNRGNSTFFNADLFVARLTDLGSSASFDWVQAGGGAFEDSATGLALSGTSLYVCGSFQSVASFGPFTLNTAGTTAFLTKVTDNGATPTADWAVALGNPGASSAAAVAVGGSRIYVGGEFSNQTTFGSTQLVSAGLSDAYVASLTDIGSTATVNWAKRGGGGAYDGVYNLTADAGNVYITGGFLSPTADFGPSTFTNLNPASTLNNTNPDLFLSRLTDTGNFVWTQQAGGAGADHGTALQVRGSTVYVVGATTQPTTFGPFTVTGPGYYVPFVASIGTGPLAAAGPARRPAQALYPNPAHDAATVLLPAAASPVRATLTLTDALGRVVRRCPVPLTSSASSYRLNLHGLPAGLYSVRVQAGATVTAEKLVVQ